MGHPHSKPRNWKARLGHELLDYWMTFVYLAALFALFAWHRRLILAEENVPITDYWMPLIEAAILAKVILIIDLFGVAHKLESRPLIVTTLYKTSLFAVGIVIFNILEATVRGLIHEGDALRGIHDFTRMNRFELMARVLSKCFALIPFFAIRELARVLGEGVLWSLFFTRHRPTACAALAGRSEVTSKV